MGRKIISDPFKLEITQGKKEGYSNINKFGVNRNISVGTKATIWEYGGLYTYSTTDDIDKISSDNVGDTQDISIQGLDIDGNLVEQTVTLTGQTPVTLTTPLWRIFRMVNISNTGNDILGTIYVYTNVATVVSGVPQESAEVRATMGEANQTLMALYTIPKGYTGYFFKGQVGMDYEGGPASADPYIRARYVARAKGKVFNTKFEGGLIGQGSSYFEENRMFPDKIEALTDIELRVVTVTENNTGAFGTFDILLIEDRVV